MSRARRELWQKWQDAIGEAMKASPIFYHRFYDTRSAQAYLPKQPADHMGLYQGRGFLVEDKSTEILFTAEACYNNEIIDGTQLAKHRIWGLRGGSAFITIFYYREDRAELWDSATIIRRHLEGGSLNDEQPLFVVEKQKTLAAYAKAIVKHALSVMDQRIQEE